MNPTGFADQVASVSLPPGWAWARLADIARINPALDIRITDDAREVTFVPMAAVNEGFGGVQRPQVRTFGQVKKGYTPFQVNDVIMAKITPCMENGKGGVVRGRDDEVFFGSTEFHVLRARAGVLPEWIGSFLAQERIRRAARLGMKGSAGQLRVPEEFLERLYLPLPSSAEQSRITDRIDELFTDLAAGVAALERVKRNLSRYRAAVLHAAVTGRLTEAWRKQHGPPDEPGPELLDRILAERRRQWEERTQAKYEKAGKQPPRGWRDRYPEPSPPKPPADGSALPTLPEGWCWAGAAQLCWGVENGNTPPPEQMFSGSGDVPFIKVYNLTKRGALDFSVKPTFVSNETHRNLLKRSVVRPGDVLMNIVGPPLGKVSLVPGDYSEWNINQAIVAYHCLDGFNHDYLVACLLCDTILRPVTEVAKASAGQFNISVSMCRELKVPLPPLAEQTAIVEAVNEKLSQIDALEAEVARGLARAARLRQSILKAAFEGKLVPQDPADEPASVLMERIRQQASDPGNSGGGHAANGTIRRRRGRPPDSNKTTGDAPAIAAEAVSATVKRSRKAEAR